MGWINLETVKNLTTKRPKYIYLQKSNNISNISSVLCAERQLKDDKLDNNKWHKFDELNIDNYKHLWQYINHHADLRIFDADK